MVNGLNRFRETFKKYNGQYVIIGGVACGLIMDEYGLNFRTTQDFDIVIIIEAITEELGKALWEFIKKGKYKVRQKSNGNPEFYRFKNRIDDTYPKEIELFSRKKSILKYDQNDRLTSIHVSDEISSLSAILLNDEYYNFLMNGLIVKNEIQLLNYTHIIPFKAKAWLDLKNRRENGEHIDSKNINKHRNDVFRLSQLLSESLKVTSNFQIKKDMKIFIEQMKLEKINPKDLGINIQKEEILSLLEKIYIL